MFLKTIKLDSTITRKNFIYLEFLRDIAEISFFDTRLDGKL